MCQLKVVERVKKGEEFLLNGKIYRFGESSARAFNTWLRLKKVQFDPSNYRISIFPIGLVDADLIDAKEIYAALVAQSEEDT